MINFTIIIPHYNSANTLDVLLSSIGIHFDVQVIIVDDKSDKGLNELNLVKEKYPYCLFLNNDTDVKGAGVCRNIGIENAKGRWLLFADSDDYFVDNWYGIVSSYMDTDADIVFFTPISEYNGCIGRRHIKYKRIIDNYLVDRDKEEIHLRIQFVTPWSKLFRHQLINDHNIRFSETLFSNDVMFVTKAGIYAKSIDATQEIIYCVQDVAGSLTKNTSFEALYTRQEVYCDVYNFLKDTLDKRTFKRTYIRKIALYTIYHGIKSGTIKFTQIKKLLKLYRDNHVSLVFL